MKLIRFMSIEEFIKYLNGEKMNSKTQWSAISKSNSVGICFFPADPPPEERMHYLSGVVDFELVIEFEIIGACHLRMGFGFYRDPDEELPENLEAFFDTPVKSLKVHEYSMDQYDRKHLKVTRIGRPYLAGWEWGISWLAKDDVERIWAISDWRDILPQYLKRGAYDGLKI